MDRTLSTFNEAQDRVKIGHFTKQGYKITGLVHVGANDGYEIEYYLKMGIAPIIALEPLEDAMKALGAKYSDNENVYRFSAALGNIDGRANLRVAPGDGKGSSMLPDIDKVDQQPIDVVVMHRWATMVEHHIVDPSKFNCCVIDVQGMELDVLRGMDAYLLLFDFISVECSLKPIYRGEATAMEIVDFLDRMGFEQDSPIALHDDVMFIRRSVLKAPPRENPIPQGTRLNIGSGQRRFEGSGWINVDCVSRPGQVPDLICDAGSEPLPYPDDSMEYVVLHQVYEHFGLGEGHALIRECHRVLKPGGSLIVTVPNMLTLADRWMNGGIDDYIYMVNVYGAYQGEPGDRHKWGYNSNYLVNDLERASSWKNVLLFDWRQIEGANIAQDWWILGVECVK